MKYTKEHAQEAPVSLEEKEWKSPFDTETQEPVETPQAIVTRQIEEKVIAKSPTPVSAPTPAPIEPAPAVASVPRVKGRSDAQRKKDWRAANRDHYLAKNREYVKASRLRKKNG
jgi:hypothetical protein